jgi:HD-like signal output (HDOD) protein
MDGAFSSAFMSMSQTTSYGRDQILKGLDRLPKMSALTMRLLSGLARQDCEVGELASLVEKDTLLSAQLLRMANSAKFARLERIQDIPHAITMVGITMMWKLALGVSISNLFSREKTAPTFSKMRFNVHSVATATLAEVLAEEAPVDHRQSAYIAGLLHDVGKLIIAVNAPDVYEEILAVSAISGRSSREVEFDLMSMDHAEISQLATSHWGLPEPIQCAVRHHHTPEDAQPMEQPAHGRIGLSVAIHKANAFVNYLGMSVLPSLAIHEQAPSLTVPGYQIAEERIIRRFHEEWKYLNNLFV